MWERCENLERLDRDQIISEYYSKYFECICNSGFQGLGSTFFHKRIEKNFSLEKPNKILEVGAGQGEHLHFVEPSELRSTADYYLLDIRTEPNNFHHQLEKINPALQKSGTKFKWIQGSVEKIPFENGSFERVVSTWIEP